MIDFSYYHNVLGMIIGDLMGFAGVAASIGKDQCVPQATYTVATAIVLEYESR